MKTKYWVLLFFIFLLGKPELTYSQFTSFTNYRDMSQYLTKLDQEGKYRDVFPILIKWMQDHPDDKVGKKVINNVFRKYYSKVINEKDLYDKIFPFLEKPGMGNLKESLVFSYKSRDEAAVDSILQKITEIDTASTGITLDYLLTAFTPIVDSVLYQKILTTLTPVLQETPDPRMLILLYNINQLELLTKFLNNVDIDTLNFDVPFSSVVGMDPLLNLDVFKKIFAKLSDNVIQKIDTLDDDITLSSIALQFYAVGDKEHSNRIVKRISDHINLNESRLSVIFCWGLSCLIEGQIFKADQFLNKVFTYGNDKEVLDHKKTLERWKSLNVQSDYITQFLARYFPDSSAAVTQQTVTVKPQINKSTEPFGTYYALIIGVEKYQDSTITSLENPVKDANRIKNILVSQYTFNENNVTLLENPDRETLIDQLNILRKKINGNTDNLLIFYAGHGYWDEEIGQGYWLPADSRIGDISNWISNSDLRDYLRGIKSKHTLLITDACFSGAIFQERDLKVNEMTEIADIYKYASRSALTSGTIKEVPDKSIFIDYLIKRLDDNKTKYLPVKDLFYSFRDAVINNSPNRQRPVYGTIYKAGDEGGDFILIRRDDKKQ